MNFKKIDVAIDGRPDISVVCTLPRRDFLEIKGVSISQCVLSADSSIIYTAVLLLNVTFIQQCYFSCYK